MESPGADIDRAKQYIAYVLKVQGGHEFDSFFGECPCGVVFHYWKAAMANRLDELYRRDILPMMHNGGVCEYSEV